MNKISNWLSLLLIIITVYWSFRSLMPRHFSDASTPKEKFSGERALQHVKNLSENPHYVGSPAHAATRDYILSVLRKLGLDPQIQEGYTAGDWGNFCKAQNIFARIKGTGNGKALLLLAHYDSAPHSSPGAGDDASGVATILEGARAFLSSGQKPVNDIIILITDAEELGLNGAKLFVNSHPWIKDVGLVLNFEARGSGGPSYMLIEANEGNGTLLKHFAKANPRYPVATSLAYSIYKLLPNDTDLTVFREGGDIEAFNFAFIDDHFDYHTALDNYQRLDRTTLEHQGTYLMPLLKYFSSEDVSNLKSDHDYVYFNFPLIHMVYYPFSWSIPLLAIAILFFIGLIVWGIRKKAISLSEAGKGFIPFLGSLLITGMIGYFSWPLLKKLYPRYEDMSHGFTYNGYWYIAAFIFLTIGISLLLYKKFQKIKAVNLVVAPLFFWLLLCTAMAVFLKGGAFFIIPGYFTLASFYVLVKKERLPVFILSLLAIPVLLILSSFPVAFPVALGLNMIVAATVFTCFIIGLLIPVVAPYYNKKLLGITGLLLALTFLVVAHLKSGFTADRPHPTSLVYFLDADSSKAFWATNNKVTDDWIEKFIGKEKNPYQDNLRFNSKYQKGFTYAAPAELKNIPAPAITFLRDTIQGNHKMVSIKVMPQRYVNLLEVIAENATIYACTVNGISLEEKFLTTKKRENRLVTHFISDNDSTVLDITISKDDKPEFTFFEVSRDLLNNSLFKIPPRPATAIPFPFIINDAIIVKKRIKL